MLSSLPLVFPRDAHSLWYTPSNSFSLAPTSAPIDPLAPPAPQNNGHLADTTISGPIVPTPRRTALSPLAQLEQDERELAARKLSIQRFGATWIRPPGIPKTYQTFLDEEAEREDELAEEQGGEGGFLDEEMDMEGGEEGEEQVDLDAEVPEGEDFLGSDLEEEESLQEAESFAELDMDADLSELEDGGEQDLDLDAEVPEAEADTLWGDDSNDFESGSEEETGGDILVTPLHGSRPQVSSPPISVTRENHRNRLSLSPGPARQFARRAPHNGQRYQSSSPQSHIPSSSPQQLLFSHDERVRGAEFVGSLGFSRRRISGNQAHSDDEMEVDSGY